MADTMNLDTGSQSYGAPSSENSYARRKRSRMGQAQAPSSRPGAVAGLVPPGMLGNPLIAPGYQSPSVGDTMQPLMSPSRAAAGGLGTMFPQGMRGLLR